MTPIRTLFIIALRNLLKAGRRTVLLMVAIASVTSLLVMMMSLTEGIRTNVIHSATVLMSGHLNVTGFFKATPTEFDPIVQETPRIKALLEEEVPGLESVVDRPQGLARIVSPTGSIQTLLLGLDIEEETAFKDVITLARVSAYRPDTAGDTASGERVEGDLERLAEPNAALLFATQAKRLGVGVGDPLTIRAQTLSGVANTADVTVVAIAEDIGLLSSFAVYLSKETVRDLYQLNPTTTGMVMAYLKNPDDSRRALRQARAALEGAGFDVMEHSDRPFFAKFQQVQGEDWTGQKIDLTTWQDEIAMLNLILTAINTVAFFLVVVLGVIIGVGMINTMLMSVRERTGEIGTLRAMGMPRGQILALFMLEAMILGFAAASVGGALGAGVAIGLDAARIHIPVEAVQAILLSDTLNLTVAPAQALGAVVAISLFAALAALWPSLRAARMQPVDAIRHVD